jgi:LacI family gluconate utilization system Gnt-I transcriptional repressor
VPQDLAVIGFGDLDFAASNRPAITTVSVDRHAIGEQAARCLPTASKAEKKGTRLLISAFTWWRASRRSSAVSHVRGGLNSGMA